MNRYTEYYSSQLAENNSQLVGLSISPNISNDKKITEKSTPVEIAKFVTKKLIDVIERDLGTKKAETKENTDNEAFELDKQRNELR